MVGVIPVPHVEELYTHIVNGATSLDETRFRDAGDPYRRAFELLRIIGDVDVPADAAPTEPIRGWGWIEFQPVLAEVLAAMREDEYLILDVKFQHTFVQFAAQGAHGMRAEVSSNAVLPPQHHLTRPQLERLVELGWRSPTGSLQQSTPDADPDGSPNFFLDLPADFDPNDLAALAVSTFIEVLQVPYPAELTYTAWGHAGPLELPALRLTDESRPPYEAPLPPPTIEPETPSSVREKLAHITAQLLQVDEAPVDEDGDFVLRLGSVVAYVRVMTDIPAVQIFSPILAHVAETPTVLEELNRTNAELRFVKLVLVGSTVVATHELHVEPFDWTQVRQAVSGVVRLADELDDELQQKIGGTLSTGESMPPPDSYSPHGYL